MMSLDDQIRKADVLIEALPYLQNFRGQTFLIKVGGSAMEETALVDSLLRDIVFLEAVGINPVLVHGGGKAITKAMKNANLEARFVAGLRFTDEKTMRIVEDTLSHVINPDLVERINQLGGRAVGLAGTAVFTARRAKARDPATDSLVDVGFVGEVMECNTNLVDLAVKGEVVPVVSPIAREAGGGHTLNVNADIAACALAKKLKAAKLIFLSDVLGVMRDPNDNATLIPTLNESAIAQLTREGIIAGGMLPKMESALESLRGGVGKVHLIDGRIPHSVVLEIFTDKGIGTEVTLV
ncbi:MAG TPA: acetylglutamate kinase [Verrucomicrobiaceae bacterium]